MNLVNTEMSRLSDLEGKNALVIFSNGQIKLVELPAYGKLEITSYDNKVKSVEQKEKSLF